MNLGKGDGIIWIDFDSTTEMVDFCDRSEPIWGGTASSRRNITNFSDWFENKLKGIPYHELCEALRNAARAIRPNDTLEDRQRSFDRALRTAFDPDGDTRDRMVKVVRELNLGPLGFASDLKFLGTRTWPEAVDLAKFGWREGREKLFAVLLIRPPFSIEPVRQPMLAYAGFMPDIPEYLSGNPEHMRDERIILQRSGRIFRFHVSALVNGNVHAAQLENGGAAVVSLIDAMETAGCRVELNWIAVSRPGMSASTGPMLIVRVRLKEADQPLDMDRLAFWCMHPGATRRMEFAVDERLDVEEWYGDDYGQAVTDPDAIRKYIPEDEILMTIGAGFSSVGDAIGHIKNQLPQEIGELIDV